MFHDLKISCTDHSLLNPLLERAKDYNYSCIALNLTYDLFNLSEQIIEEFKDFCKKAKLLAKEKNIKILKRITFVLNKKCDENKIIKRLKLDKFDLLAVIPTSQVALEQASHDLSIDIICFEKNSFPLLKIGSCVDIAINRKIKIELEYGDAIRGNSEDKEFLFGHAMAILRRSRRENFIISSGARNLEELRSPHDAINLGYLFGLNKNSSYATLTTNSASAVTHGYTRASTIKGTFKIKLKAPLNKASSEQKKTNKRSWKKLSSEENAAKLPKNEISNDDEKPLTINYS